MLFFITADQLLVGFSRFKGLFQSILALVTVIQRLTNSAMALYNRPAGRSLMLDQLTMTNATVENDWLF